MRCSQECPVLSLLLHFVFLLASGQEELPDSGSSSRLFSFSTEQGQLVQSASAVHIYPEKTDAHGEFISHSLAHHFQGGRVRRDLQPFSPEGQVYYRVNYEGRVLMFNLTTNDNLVSNDYILERRNGSADRTEHRRSGGNSCHLHGTVETSDVRGTAAISTCKGLRGFFSLPEGQYFIEPVQKSPDDPAGTPEPHIIYPRVTADNHRKKRSLESKETPSPCGVQDAPSASVQVERDREEWEREQQQRGEDEARSRSQRSVSRERWVETMVVADSKLIEYHGSDNVESYIFTIMNMVAGIFHDASIGNAIHVILVRLILLQGEEKGLKIAHHADSTLASFCAWQKNLNPQSDTHPAHHDVAVLITRKDICAGMNQPCETLGLSHLSGMCQPHRSCNINEDSGLPVAFTVAHEMGHSFGIHHDGQGNDCELEGRHPFIMSRQLMYDSSPLTWSSCSKEYITRFLDRGWGFCLDDRPSKRDLTTPLARLGVRYTTHHQCQLQYGPNATFCPEVDNVCQILWCSVNGSCRSKLDSPIDGTRCGPEKWCISGECVIVGKLPETVNGGWGQWSTWSHCSKTCGTGVQSADRECNNPKPEFGGKYCTGERKRYRTCNTKPCQNNKPTFREMQCSEFDTVAYQNELYQWIPVSNPLNPCELHCRPASEYFSEKMLDTVTDGTPCFMNNKSRNLCVNGVCKELGCDYGIDSNAVEDRCGVCLGDGTSCETVHKTFDQAEGFGYMDVGVIPEGARDILVKEVEEAGNFLALRSAASEEYFLNGNFIIQWNGEYEAGGTTFYYERSGNMENLTAPGPTKKAVMLQLLFQENNPGLKYEYIIKKTKETGNEIIEPIYRWRHGAWTDCSTTCGLGEQYQPVRCFEMDVGVVDEFLCDPEGRPEDRHRKCKTMDCPARWWVGGWQQCTATCGSDGVRKRTVLCVRTVSAEERVLHPVECKHLLKPKPVVPCNRDVPCGQDWAVGSWQECPVTCGGGVRSRTVTCAIAPIKTCDLSTKPRSRSLCALQTCPNSGLRRRPGPPPKYRHPFPPKSHPTQPPGSPTSALTTTVAPTTTTPVTNKTTKQSTTAFVPTTTSLSTPETTTSDIVDADEYEFNVIMRKKGDKRGRVLPSTSSPVKKDRKETGVQKEIIEGEEGSTPNVVMYTPGNDYVVDERTTEEEGIIDLDVFTTATPFRNVLKSTTVQTSPTSMHTTRKHTTTTYPTPHTRTETWVKTTPHLTNANTSTHTLWTHRAPHATPTTKNHSVSQRSGLRTTRAPSTTARKLFTTEKSPQSTVKIIKVKKPAVTPKKNSPTSPGKKASPRSKGFPKNQKQQPQRPRSSSTGDQSNLMAREPVNMDLYWVVGNWSECSTTCGIGAVWRMVMCSSGNDEDCANTKRPEPARTCQLQPCAIWQSGSWSKCPDCVAAGRRYRDVQCVDSQTKRPLRPFHCQAVSSKPISSLTCPHKPCMTWSVSPWKPCSSSCGKGIKERLVHCPEPHRCSNTLRPNTTEPCILKPCTQWNARDWEECSVSCGGGQQQRQVDCVNDRDLAVTPNNLCEKKSKPETLRKCNIQECKTNTGPACKKNTMSSRFCDKLKLLGRCSFRSVHRQCCVTCGP
ncbi:A disintegrin and metalloproteinase with thrombospondin motifs 12-like [Solea senegalensis]|uniref:A disintegrin and metalloproteinase with thrombospondin motifs 12-like n=2 Tax=Solea senegalensis TaxID=28829 RepID=A0AAV6QJ09_SOLSE|nr:A disintegrin and metalloproteinase with thrombospondin motifs 12 [Solea senegalensis]KAG7490435.1 A disintegrin and metalloproteinase with thrombospondin motifs 12-like [Solea senegalensis]